jgi:hypothetical protein
MLWACGTLTTAGLALAAKLPSMLNVRRFASKANLTNPASNMLS